MYTVVSFLGVIQFSQKESPERLKKKNLKLNAYRTIQSILINSTVGTELGTSGLVRDWHKCTERKIKISKNDD